jgi:hypothetical protein
MIDRQDIRQMICNRFLGAIKGMLLTSDPIEISKNVTRIDELKQISKGFNFTTDELAVALEDVKIRYEMSKILGGIQSCQKN